MYKKIKHLNHLKYIYFIGILLTIVVVTLLTTQIQNIPASPLPYDPAYYGWPNVISGRRVIMVIDTENNPCSIRNKKAIVIETLDTVTQQVPSTNIPTLSPPEVILLLDPTGNTAVIERPYATKDTLIKNYLSSIKFLSSSGCAKSGAGLILTPAATMPTTISP